MKVNSATEKTIQSELNIELIHEIGHPIHAILNLCKLLEDTLLDEVQQNYLTHIYQSAEFLQGLLFSEHRNEPSLSLFGIRDVINNVFFMLLGKAKVKDVAFSYEVVDGTTEHWMGYPNSIMQILLNLLDNGIKYTEQGFVRLTVSETVQGHLSFLIEDTGIGIPSQGIEDVMKPYMKIDKHKEGFGLGLSIVSKKVQSLGGQIQISSKIHEGTRVVVTLPLQKIAFEASQPVSTKGTVLLVDDHELVRMVTSKILIKEGFQVISAENGKVALALLQRESITCVLLDMEMPIMDGLETLQQIRQLGFDQLPVIVMTGKNVEHKQYWQTLGFDGFISKPSAPSELVETLRIVLNRHIS